MMRLNLLFALFCSLFHSQSECTHNVQNALGLGQTVLSSLKSDEGPTPVPAFESFEHASIGDSIVLRYPDTNISGAMLDYDVRGTDLSFGECIALAGNFYYKTTSGDCEPSITNDWDRDPEKSIADAAGIVDTLRTDFQGDGDLACVVKLLREARDHVRNAAKRGKDIAQAYRVIREEYAYKFEACAIRSYARTALCKSDHSGKDAERAYSSLHSLALWTAVKAHDIESLPDLKEAYFIDAFAQHYLIDLFAANHPRVPRQTQHFTPDLELSLGEEMARAEYDEDEADGQWVTNKEGQYYEDKQLGQDRFMLHSASQASVDEIWEAFQLGKRAEPEGFKAFPEIQGKTVP